MSSQLKTAATTLRSVEQVDLKKALAEAFPEVDPGLVPLGSRIVVQLRQPKMKAGSIFLADETRDAEKWNTQIALVRVIGPVAFRSRSDLDHWPEGEWVQPGDFVRVPKYNGDRIEVPYPGGKALFAVFNDLELIAKVTGNPLDIVGYV